MAEKVDPMDTDIACTLGASDVADRLAAWQAVLGMAVERRPTANGAEVRFPNDPAVLGELAALSAREVECCSFFTFTLTIDVNAAWLAVAAPPDAVPIVAELFGT